MSRTVSVMEGHGWLTRQRSTEDRRTVFVSLTPLGEQALKVVEKIAIECASTLLNCLSQSEAEALHSGLEALHRVVQEHLGTHYEERGEPFQTRPLQFSHSSGRSRAGVPATPFRGG